MTQVLPGCICRPGEGSCGGEKGLTNDRFGVGCRYCFTSISRPTSRRSNRHHRLSTGRGLTGRQRIRREALQLPTVVDLACEPAIGGRVTSIDVVAVSRPERSGHGASAAENGSSRRISHQNMIPSRVLRARHGSRPTGSSGIMDEQGRHRAKPSMVTSSVRRSRQDDADEQSSSCAISAGVEHQGTRTYLLPGVADIHQGRQIRMNLAGEDTNERPKNRHDVGATFQYS